MHLIPRLCLSMLLAAAGLHALTVDSAFPGGNGRVTVEDGDVITMLNDNSENGSPWFYWCFRVRGAAGRTLSFNVTSTFPNVVDNRGPGVSFDQGRTWRWLHSQSKARGASFHYTFPADADDVRFSFGMPYQQSNLDTLRARHAGNPALRVSTLCTTDHGRQAELIRLGAVAPAYRVAIAAREHASEMMTNWILDGLIEEVLSESAAGTWLRQHVEFIIVPFLDKDGVEEGDQGKHRSPHDPAYDFDTTRAQTYATVRAVMQQSPAWVGTVPTVAFNWHCPGYGGQYWDTVIQSFQGGWDAQAQDFMLQMEANQRGRLRYRLAHDIWPHSGFSGDPVGENYIPGLIGTPPPLVGSTTGNTPAACINGSFRGWMEKIPGVNWTAYYEVPYAQFNTSTDGTPNGVVSDAVRYHVWGRDNARGFYHYFRRFVNPVAAPAVSDLTAAADVRVHGVSSEAGAAEGLAKAVDDDPATAWRTAAYVGQRYGNAWAAWRWDSKVRVTAVALRSKTASDQFNDVSPRDIRLEACDDGVSWTTIHRRPFVHFAAAGDRVVSSFENEEHHQYWRLVIDRPRGLSATRVQIAEIELLGPATRRAASGQTGPATPPAPTVTGNDTVWPVISGRTTAGAAVHVRCEDFPYGTTWADASGDWHMVMNDLLTGSFPVRVIAETAAGCSAVSPAVTVTMRGTPPAVDPVALAGDGTVAPVLSGSNRPGAVIHVRASNRQVLTTVVAADGTWSCPLAGQPAGRRAYTVLAHDDGGTTAPGAAVQVTIAAGGGANAAPQVDAGPARSVVRPATASLDGTVTDDGLPGGAVTVLWEKVSGPGTVGFANTGAVDTTATFSEAGSYVLRLTANDGSLSGSDTVMVQVSDAPVSPPPVPQQTVTVQAAGPAGSCGAGTAISMLIGLIGLAPIAGLGSPGKLAGNGLR